MYNLTNILFDIVVILIAVISSYLFVRGVRVKSGKSKYLLTVLKYMLQCFLAGVTVWGVFLLSQKIDKGAKEKITQNHIKDSVNYKRIKDSIAQKDTLLIKLKKEHTIKVIQKYFDVSVLRDTVRYDSLFTFPVKKYFTFKNIHQAKLNERMRFYWRHNPSFKFMVTPNNSQSNDCKDSIVATITLKNIDTSTQLMRTIKYDKNFKIYYIGDYYLTPKSDFDNSTDNSFTSGSKKNKTHHKKSHKRK